MRNSLLASAILLLSACAVPQKATVDPASLLDDAAFDRAAAAAQPDLFGLNDAMRRYLTSDIARQVRVEGRLRGLVQALESNQQLRLKYDAARTRTAAEAFDARAGNCLSLTIMTAALARELGLSVAFRRVHAAPVWSRSGETLIASGHVNVLLAPPANDGARSVIGLQGIIVDFEPGAAIERQRAQEIGERTVVAMFRNNLAAEAMQRGALDEAYWWVRGAAREDPYFFEAFNTLGVLYRRRGNLAGAEAAFRYVLALESENVAALANLAGVLERGGRAEEARVLLAKLQRIEPHPPFHYYALGIAALERGDFALAREHFVREVDRNAAYHGTHFGLALAYLGLRNARAAREHLRLAQETSTSAGERELYAGKLARLQSLGVVR